MTASTAPQSKSISKVLAKLFVKSPLAGFYRPVEGAFSVSCANRVSVAQERFSHFGGRLPSRAAKVVLQLAYGGERGACGLLSYSRLPNAQK